MSDMFSPPASTQGIDLAAVKGHLLLISPTSHEIGVVTSFGPADPIRANVVDLDSGDTYEDILIFPRVLVSQLKPRIGGKVLGRLGQGVAKAGQSAPWTLDAFSPEDAKKAEAYLAKAPSFTPATAGPAASNDTPPPF